MNLEGLLHHGNILVKELAEGINCGGAELRRERRTDSPIPLSDWPGFGRAGGRRAERTDDRESDKGEWEDRGLRRSETLEVSQPLWRTNRDPQTVLQIQR